MTTTAADSGRGREPSGRASRQRSVVRSFRSRPFASVGRSRFPSVTSADHESSTTAPPHVVQRLHALLDDLPELSGTPRTIAALEGGLTNFNFKVSTPERTAVVRLSSSDGDLLAIDREAEHVNSLRAAESGAAPAVLAYRPDHQALVVAWLERDDADRAGPARRAERGPGCGGVPAAALRAALRGRLRHVRGAAPLPRDRAGPRLPAAAALPRPAARGGPDRRRTRRTHGADGALQQRPARRELHRRRRPALGHRLRVRRQQRPVLRARQHLERVGPAARPPRAAGGQLLRRGTCATRWRGPGCSG